MVMFISDSTDDRLISHPCENDGHQNQSKAAYQQWPYGWQPMLLTLCSMTRVCLLITGPELPFQAMPNRFLKCMYKIRNYEKIVMMMMMMIWSCFTLALWEPEVHRQRNGQRQKGCSTHLPGLAYCYHERATLCIDAAWWTHYARSHTGCHARSLHALYCMSDCFVV